MRYHDMHLLGRLRQGSLLPPRGPLTPLHLSTFLNGWGRMNAFVHFMLKMDLHLSPWCMANVGQMCSSSSPSAGGESADLTHLTAFSLAILKCFKLNCTACSPTRGRASRALFLGGLGGARQSILKPYCATDRKNLSSVSEHAKSLLLCRLSATGPVVVLNLSGTTRSDIGFFEVSAGACPILIKYLENSISRTLRP